jgi:hypothetical protein
VSYNPTAAPAPYQFGENGLVPAGGTLQLLGPGQTSAGFRIIKAGTIIGASISVNTTSTNDYNLEIRVNGSTVTTVALAAGNTSAASILSTPVAAGDILTAFMVRTSGTGGSSFNEQQAVIQISS